MGLILDAYVILKSLPSSCEVYRSINVQIPGTAFAVTVRELVMYLSHIHVRLF